MNVEQAVRWVEKNRGLIIFRTRKFLPFTPYDREDFVQDAYEAAIVASAVASKKGLAFEACFWTVFNRTIGNVVPNPLSPRHSGSNSPASTICDDVEALANMLSASEEERPWHDVDRLYLAICPFLSEREKKVWSLTLGITGKGRMSNYEIAEELGCSAANVRQTQQRVLDRLSNQVQSGALHIPTSTVEVRHLTVVAGMETGRRRTHTQDARPHRLAEVG